MSTMIAGPAEDVVVLRNVSWETYERLLADRGEDPRPLITYDRGVLEIMSPGRQHESLGRLVTMVVAVLSEEWDLPVADFGSMTFSDAGWQRGFEPDGCFYVGPNADTVDRLERIDPRRDPAPDVVVEIDISRSSIRKLAIFAQFGVGEVWQHDGERMAFRVLDGDRYVPAEASRAFPALTAEALNRLLGLRGELPSPQWLRAVRAWARDAHAD